MQAPATKIPAGAPATGGGGTAGLQYAALFGLGGAAIVAGLGSLAYRRKLTHKLTDKEPRASLTRRS